jgi:UDPglucose 6-dehydrogenase
MNDIANLCDIVGANVNEVRKGIGSDVRIGNKFIYPGIGYGGSCFPKDVKALIKTGEKNNYKLRILHAVDEVNNDQKKVIVNKIMQHFDGDIKGKRFAIWGLAFKPKTDDMREAPSLVLIDALIEAGAKVQAYDPVAKHEAKHLLKGKAELKDDAIAAAKNADAIVLVTEWPEFRLPDWEVICKKMKGTVIFDGRNIYHKSEMKKLGFTYYGIGIGK